MPLLCEAELDVDVTLAHLNKLDLSGPICGATRVCRAVSPWLLCSRLARR
jgi:hypothetical protein